MREGPSNCFYFFKPCNCPYVYEKRSENVGTKREITKYLYY